MGTSARVRRFVLVGTTAGLAQLGLLEVFIRAGVHENLANLAAFGVSVQVNFVMSQFYTWRDRWTPTVGLPGLVRRLFVFNGSAAITGVINQGVFGLANLLIWYQPAAALGIATAAVTNFLLNNQLVFRLRNSQRLAATNGDSGRGSTRRSPTGPPA